MDLPFQLEALPDMTVLTRHFRPSARYSLALEGGRMDVTESSIGPEVSMLMGIAAIGGASVFGASAGFDGAGDEWDDEEMVIEFAGQPLESEEGVEPGPTGQTQSSLMGLSMGIQMFQVQNEGKAPASLAELQGGGPSEPGTIKELPSDGWGRGFKYSNEGGKVRIWSIGANGIDENGEGDDLLLEL